MDPRSTRSRTWTVPATPEHASRLRRSAASFAAGLGVAPPALMHVEIATSEALGNAVLHAYEGGPVGSVALSMALDPPGERLLVEVTDDGSGSAWRPDSPGLGLGTTLMERLAQHLEVVRGGEGTCVRMLFDLEPQPAPG